jgi:hypothetical protein
VPEKTAPDLITLPGDASLVLSGPPSKLTGQVELLNTGAARVVVRDAGVKDPGGVLTGGVSRPAFSTLVLHPNQGRTVPLKIALAPSTPPGEYHVELDVAGQSRPLVLNVMETFDVTVQPDTLVVANLPGQAQHKRLSVTNEGNVAFTIGALGPVDLEDDLAQDRIRRLVVEPWAETTDLDIEALVVAILRATREEVPPGSLEVSNLTGDIRVMPGQTVSLDLAITLQTELPPNRRYRGVMPLLTTDLEIFVVASSEPVGEEPSAPSRKSAPKKASTRSRTSRSRKTTKG